MISRFNASRKPPGYWPLIACDAGARSPPSQSGRGAAPPAGRKPDSRLQAILERLGELAHYDEEYVKVAEMNAHLARLGYGGLPHGYASNALGRLAERGLVVKVAYGRFRINDMHPELVALRFKLLDSEVARMDARDQALRDAETRGRRMAGRR